MSLPNSPACKVCNLPVSENFNKAYDHLAHHLLNGHITGNQCLFCVKKLKCRNGNLKDIFHRHLEREHKLKPIQSVRKHVCKICGQSIVLFDQQTHFVQNYGLIKDHYLKNHWPLHSTGFPPPTKCIFQDCHVVWTSREKVLRCFRNHQYNYPFELVFPSLDTENNNDNDTDYNDNDDEDHVDDGNESGNPGSSNDQPFVQILQPANRFPDDCFDHAVDMDLLLGSLYGSLKYVYKTKNVAIDLVSNTLKTIGIHTHKEIKSILDSCAQQNNIEQNNPFLLDLKKHFGKMFDDFSRENSYGSAYRRLKTFDQNEEVLEPQDIFMEEKYRKKHKIVMFDCVALIERFLKSKDIQSVWKSAKKEREENDKFNLECLANNQPENVRYLSLYDGRRIKEKLATLEANVCGVIMELYMDDFGIDAGYSHRASSNKLLGKCLNPK